MCKWGTDAEVSLCKPTPVQQRNVVKIDSCIAPLVQMLNKYGIETIASCCGHGKVEESSIIINAKNISLRPLDNGGFRAHLIFPYIKESKDASRIDC